MLAMIRNLTGKKAGHQSITLRRLCDQVLIPLLHKNIIDVENNGHEDKRNGDNCCKDFRSVGIVLTFEEGRRINSL